MGLCKTLLAAGLVGTAAGFLGGAGAPISAAAARSRSDVATMKVFDWKVRGDVAPDLASLDLSNMKVSPGSHKSKTRKGRGISAGQGATCGFGTRGQKSRSGRSVRPGFEGGQIPLYRRLPKFVGRPMGPGHSKTEFGIVKLNVLNSVAEGETVDYASLQEKSLVSKSKCVLARPPPLPNAIWGGLHEAPPQPPPRSRPCRPPSPAPRAARAHAPRSLLPPSPRFPPVPAAAARFLGAIGRRSHTSPASARRPPASAHVSLTLLAHACRSAQVQAEEGRLWPGGPHDQGSDGQGAQVHRLRSRRDRGQRRYVRGAALHRARGGAGGGGGVSCRPRGVVGGGGASSHRRRRVCARWGGATALPCAPLELCVVCVRRTAICGWLYTLPPSTNAVGMLPAGAPY